MKNKKSRRASRPVLDERSPAKAAVDGALKKQRPVDPPLYDGPPKDDKPPELRKGRSKDAFDKKSARPPRQPREMTGLADMEPPRRPRGGSAEPPEQYVRLRVLVRGDRMSIVDSHLVDGPLSPVAAFPGDNAYEVTLGDRLLHAGSLPDLGVQRSFVAPNAPEQQRSHHIAERDAYEFSARVPAGEINPDTIGDIAVRLHRVKGEARADRLTGERLDVQFEREMRVVSELRGLPEAALPEAIVRRGATTPRL